MSIRTIKTITVGWNDVDCDVDDNEKCNVCKKEGAVLTFDIHNDFSLVELSVCPDCLRDFATQAENWALEGDAA